ncbi:MAG: hypothetical protein QOE82_1960, partial [Thermoanaerobaculia bacterium]|nr:hypothetical protein [Thermoanaerobaculia bacterium]
RRFRDREVFFVLAAIGIFVLLANVKPAVSALHAVIGIAANARLRFLFAWILAVLIAAALERFRRAPLAIGLAASALLIVLIVIRTPFPSGAARHDGLIAIIPSAIVLAIAASALVPRFRPVASPALVAAVIAEMWPLTIGWNSAVPINTFYPRTPLIDAVLRHHRPGFDRVAGIGGVLFPNTNAIFGIEDARVHDPMEPAPYVHSIGGAITHDYYKKWIDDSSPLLDRLNVRYVMTEPNRELTDTTRYVLRYGGPDGRLYENLHAMPRFFAENARVTITAARGDAYTLDVDAARPTTVMSSVGASRWWRVTNADATPRNEFLEVTVSPGHTTVRIRYVDTHFRNASIIALLTAAALVCFMIRARVQRHLDLHRRALRDRDRMPAPLESGGP